MKKSYIKISIFQIIAFIILFLNSFAVRILKNYYIILFFLIMLIIFKLLFGFEKDRHRHTKSIIFEILIFLLIYFLLYYIIGILIGFARTPNYLNWYGFKTFILPIILIIPLKEYFRYQMLSKSEGSKTLIIFTTLLMIFIDITNILALTNLTVYNEALIFIALSLLPAITTNIMASYITTKVGYIPIIIYLYILGLYQFIVPIIPNPNEYLKSIIDLFVPIILTFRLFVLFTKNADDDIPMRKPDKSQIFWLFPIVIVIVLVYFVSGYFRYYSLAIATGSMDPKIRIGDVVIVDQKYNANSLEVGNVLAYNKDGHIIVHRIIKIVKYKDEFFFYTKGDANNTEDKYKITENQIVGLVKWKIKYIGYPTVWISKFAS